ncbi:hypothetical protein TIFTF001_019668 [Ficus carica]|uniref:Uncharacterized protein n=1 Tax=Ficus carica TaxID=3494 RepID=A0AA88AC56_FICCA|nr:hypothetical protein TIFTF001_019668 [Ficus carica]
MGQDSRSGHGTGFKIGVRTEFQDEDRGWVSGLRSRFGTRVRNKFRDGGLGWGRGQDWGFGPEPGSSSGFGVRSGVDVSRPGGQGWDSGPGSALGLETDIRVGFWKEGRVGIQYRGRGQDWD